MGNKTNQKRICGIIPARYASSRFPGKPLYKIKGKPMLQWVYEACINIFEDLYIATDDVRIEQAANAFGANVIRTNAKHNTGTDRLGEAIQLLEKKLSTQWEIVVNIQGDEPLISSEQLFELISCFDSEKTQIATLVKQFSADENPEDPNIVKVVCKENLEAMYFSRSIIPYSKNKEINYFKHIGLYAYKSDVLKEIVTLQPTQTELSESLEQLRWLGHGYTIQTKITQHQNIGVDVPDDIKKIENLLS